ncbi:hypothetical protein GSI_07678 [Ganoderma sinense ZZ0214-1]|nr:hypothetical protein GSI_07678 [Ganoderma sinense ZZ0214-1]
MHLSFLYQPNNTCTSDDVANSFDLLLQQVSIPATCHMYLAAPAHTTDKNPDLHSSAADILDSVCRRVPGKDAVSHMFLHLPAPELRACSPMQLVFPQGSLRLLIPCAPGGMTSTFLSLKLFCAFPRLFAPTRELRIHYTNLAVMAALGSQCSAAFPNLTALSVIQDMDNWWPTTPKPALSAGLALLVQPPPSSSRSTGISMSESEPDSSSSSNLKSGDDAEPQLDPENGSRSLAHQLPFPALDTLWTTVESRDDIASLERTLAARAALGAPIRRLVVTPRARARSFPAAQLEWEPGLELDSDSDAVARLRALAVYVADGADVTVMEAEAARELGEVDWLARLPERYELAACVHRGEDWPTVWDRQKYV